MLNKVVNFGRFLKMICLWPKKRQNFGIFHKHLIISTISKTEVERAVSKLRNEPFQTPKRTLSECETNPFGMRKRLF